MSTSIGYIDAFMQDLIRAKHVYYSEECFSHYLEEDQFLIEDLHNVNNKWGERIKCTLVRHRDPENGSCDTAGMNARCIVYLHGFGSCRLESLNLLPLLPKNYSLCMFDLSGSGKSQGQFMTYGLKESEDIESVISQLVAKKGIVEFVLWGRSMGAVATLLYAIQKCPYIARKSVLVRRNHFDSLKSSRYQSCQNEATDNSFIKAIILDSPFQNFRQVAKQIAISRLSIPAFLVDFAMKYVEQSFSHILRDEIGQQYSPFNICFNKQISLSVPAIILSSQKDEVVSSSHSERIAKLIVSRFQKIPINSCNHNQPRPEKIVSSVFEKLDKYLKTQKRITKYSSISVCSSQRKRGIFVFTPSKQKQCRTDSPKRSYYQSRFLITPQQSPKNNPSYSHQRTSKSLKKSKIFLQSSSKTHKQPAKQQYNMQVNFLTVDSQASNLINKKLVGTKQTQATNYRLLRSRRVIQRKKQFRCTAQSQFS